MPQSAETRHVSYWANLVQASWKSAFKKSRKKQFQDNLFLSLLPAALNHFGGKLALPWFGERARGGAKSHQG